MDVMFRAYPVSVNEGAITRRLDAVSGRGGLRFGCHRPVASDAYRYRVWSPFKANGLEGA